MNQKINEKIEVFLAAHRDELIADLFTLVQIPSVQSAPEGEKPYGAACAQALDAALTLCRAQDLETENISYRCGSALWKGPGAGEFELGFVSHLDVVPAGDGWTGKPFEPFLRDGFAIGRGVRDNKNGAVAGLYAVRCLKALEIPLRHRVRLIFGCAEETGMDDLPYYLQKRTAPAFSLVPDTAFPVCHGEKGIYTADLLLPVGEDVTAFSGGIAANVVPSKACAQVGEASFEAIGRSSHASRPQGSLNAVRVLAETLLQQRETPLSPTTIHSMQFICDTLEDHFGERLGIAAQDEASGALTCICGLARLEETCIRMSLNIRYPVTHDGALITAGLQKYADENGMRFVFNEDSKPNYLPADHPAIAQLTQIYADVTGEVTEPYVMGGGTYARHLPNAVAFGPDFPDEEVPCPSGHGDCHEPDECQSIHGLMTAIRIYVHALLVLDSTVE